jgi:hypothetical protein
MSLPFGFLSSKLYTFLYYYISYPLSTILCAIR